MKPDYKNWVPRGLLFLLGGMAIICLALCIVFGMAGVATEGGLRIALGVLFGAAFLLFAVLTGIFANMYCAFSYNGKRKISKRVIEGIAKYVTLPDGGRGLDVGCGSGALTIACAKRNPRAQMVGIDRWGKEYPIDDVDVLLSESQFKTAKYYDSWDEYLGYANAGNIQ